MKFRIELKPKAEKDLKSPSSVDCGRVVERLRWLENNLRGDIKRLSNHFPEYRMGAGDYRVLFEVADDQVIVYRILHRRESYR